MKKIFFLAAMLVVAVSLNAQIGAKIGANFMGLSSDDPDEYGKMGVGLHAGLVYEKTLGPIGIRTEALFSQSGYNSYAEVGGITTDAKIRLSYLQIPVLAKVELGPVYAVAGPYFGYALSGNIGVEVSGGGVSASTDTDLFEEIEDGEAAYDKLDYGLAAGAGFKFDAGPLAAFIEARASIGLNNIENTTLSFIPEDYDGYTRTLTFGVSAGFLIGN